MGNALEGVDSARTFGGHGVPRAGLTVWLRTPMKVVESERLPSMLHAFSAGVPYRFVP
jgi:hypothetical protein